MKYEIEMITELYDNKMNKVHQKSYHLGTDTTVFQAEVYAIKAAVETTLVTTSTNADIIIHSDSQASVLLTLMVCESPPHFQHLRPSAKPRANVFSLFYTSVLFLNCFKLRTASAGVSSVRNCS